MLVWMGLSVHICATNSLKKTRAGMERRAFSRAFESRASERLVAMEARRLEECLEMAEEAITYINNYWQGRSACADVAAIEEITDLRRCFGFRCGAFEYPGLSRGWMDCRADNCDSRKCPDCAKKARGAFICEMCG